jgi:proteic killer suppression protein
MIRTWANAATERLARTGKSKFVGLDVELAIRRLNALNSSAALSDISPLKSLNLHPLKGDRKGQWAINVNGPWRICFCFKNGDAWDVEIVNYH